MHIEEAQFLLKHDVKTATDVVRLSLTHGNAMWRTFIDAGLASYFKRGSDRHDLLNSLNMAENTDDAIVVLRHLLDALTPEQCKKAFSASNRGVLVESWLNSIALDIAPEGGAHLLSASRIQHTRALIGTLREYSVEINMLYSKKSGPSGNHRTSILAELTPSLNYELAFKEQMANAEQRLRMLFEFGATLDTPTKIYALNTRMTKHCVNVVQWFDKNGFAKIDEWLTESKHTEALPQNVAMIQSMCAMRAIDAVSKSVSLDAKFHA